ncbi:C-_U-editing enzyme APOBEC-1-like isoform X1 [Cavia porcellus]|uniref:C->U-editing enzyme APOBEC-1 n=2 Tax=Cavia porcellus TaxID=10141 RepID=A0A286XNR2_CAVPO|nr:C->U-editing enzyme APOBEC-1-like [Cavia porcellus]
MASGTGPSTGDATLRRRIEPWQFEAYFDPRQLRKEACMLSEVRWGASPRTWRESSLNTTSHVEINFIEKFTSGRSLRPAVRCSMTWFLSWSPCWECARAIREFLHQHPNVSLVIYVARLYWHVDEQNRQGLRDLVTSGVRVQIMSDSEYRHCWRNFVNFPPGQEAGWPRFPPMWTTLYALELSCILLSLPPCLKISRRRQYRLIVFQLILQTCHYRAIPPQVLSAAELMHPLVAWC